MRSQRTSLVAIAIFLMASWVVPGLALVYLPLRYLDTHLHEMSHALASILTGGHNIRIHVYSDGSGVMDSFGGWSLIVSPAGYVGAAAFGAVMILMSRHEKSARAALYGLSSLLAISMILWVRGDLVGVLSGLFYVGSIFAAARYLPQNGAALLVQFIGLVQCLASLQSVLVLLNINVLASRETSDATILAGETGVPAIFWALAWTAASMVLVGFALRAAWKCDESAQPHLDSDF